MKRRMGWVLLWITVPVMAQLSLTDPGYRQNKAGNELFSSGKYEQAMGAYTRALSFREKDDEIRYNLANSLLKMGRTDEAMKVYDELLKKVPDRLKGPVSYNAGNAMFQAQEYGKALDYYRRALMADPKDRWAKENFELALKKLKEQQQKQNRDKKDKSKDDQKKKQDTQKQDDQQKKDRQEQQPQQQKQQKQQQNQKKSRQKKQQVERMLRALREQEKQDRKKNAKRKKAHVVDRSGKDW